MLDTPSLGVQRSPPGQSTGAESHHCRNALVGESLLVTSHACGVRNNDSPCAAPFFNRAGRLLAHNAIVLGGPGPIVLVAGGVHPHLQLKLRRVISCRRHFEVQPASST